jgi:hypothetical protein
MEKKTSLETDDWTVGQEISHILWNPEVNYHDHKSTPLMPTLSQMNPVHTLWTSFFNIRFNII